MSKFKILYDKPKSLLRRFTQQLFLKLLLKLFPKKFISYKNKLKTIINLNRNYLYFNLITICLKLRYPLYINLPSKHIYAFHILINFLKILKFQKIDFFLIAGSLLGAVRQESFAGRPSDIDLGIREDQLPELFNSIPLLKKNGALNIRVFPDGKPTLFQILYPFTIIDVEVYRKEKIGKNIIWIGKNDKNKTITFPIMDLKHLIPIKLYGKKFSSPSNPKIYLEKKFGKNWQTPDKKQFVWQNKFL